MTDDAGPYARFPTTRASAVRGLGSENAAERARSWDTLVAAYFRPIYKHLRVRWRLSREDAEDLTQSFFTQALQRDFFRDFDPGRARFRTFVRLCLDRFASNEKKAAGRLKRGGDVEIRSLDFDAAEAELALAADASPEEMFEREWRRSLFATAIEALRSECHANGRSDAFAIFERYDLSTDAQRPTYADLARELGVPPTTVTNRLALVRRELRRVVLATLASLTATEEELRSEAKALFGADLDGE